jgi:hypothetical protein
VKWLKELMKIYVVAVCIDITGLAPNLTVPNEKLYIDHYMKERFVMTSDTMHCGR